MPEQLKALVGLKGLRYFPVTTHTTEIYTVGPKAPINAVQELSKADNTSDYTINADDDIYATGSQINYVDINVTVAELDLQLEAQLQGAEYASDSNSYSFKDYAKAPEMALGFAGARLDGGYRMFMYYSCKLMSIQIDHKTRTTDNVEIQVYKLQFRAKRRKVDGMLRSVADTEAGDPSLVWLDTVPLPIISGS